MQIVYKTAYLYFLYILQIVGIGPGGGRPTNPVVRAKHPHTEHLTEVLCKTGIPDRGIAAEQNGERVRGSEFVMSDAALVPVLGGAFWR